MNPILKDARTLLVQLKFTTIACAVVKKTEGLREDFYRAAKVSRTGSHAYVSQHTVDPVHYETQLDRQESDRPLEVIDHTTQLTMTPIHHHFRKQHFELLKERIGNVLEQRNTLAGLFRDLEQILDAEAAPFKEAMQEMSVDPCGSVVDGRYYFITDVVNGADGDGIGTSIESGQAGNQDETGS